MGLLDQYGHTPVRAPGGKNVRVIAFSGTTNGSGVLTLNAGSDYDHTNQITKSGNNYIVSVGPYVAVLACVARTTSTVSSGTVLDPAAGTVQINFGSSQNSVQINVQIVVDVGAG